MTDNFTRLQVEAIQCVWEEVLERLNNAHIHPQLEKYRSDYGSAQLRSDCVDVGVWAEAAAELIPEDLRDGVAYDWEIIPAFVGLVDWEKHFNPYSSAPPALPPLDEAARAVARPLYDAECDRELKQLYGIDFTTDSGANDADMQRWFESYWAGDETASPEAIAKWWGEEHDLNLLDED